jgi:hypothetical protein
MRTLLDALIPAIDSLNNFDIEIGKRMAF